MGQGDATLIQTAGKNILIDSGTRASSDILLNYLKAQGVTELELCVATHPHEDHIGGMPDVLNAFTVKELYMPTKTTTTKIFQSMVETAQQRGVTITPAKVGDTFTIGDANLQILFPDREYKDLNNNSVTIQMSLGGKTFLFTGDNEKESEATILSNFGNALKSDVFQAGHHGSDTSNTAAFLQAVSPAIVVISCGQDNSYGHPHAEVLQRFEQLGATIYRTDLDGTIVITIESGYAQRTERIIVLCILLTDLKETLLLLRQTKPCWTFHVLSFPPRHRRVTCCKKMGMCMSSTAPQQKNEKKKSIRLMKGIWG